MFSTKTNYSDVKKCKYSLTSTKAQKGKVKPQKRAVLAKLKVKPPTKVQ